MMIIAKQKFFAVHNSIQKIVDLPFREGEFSVSTHKETISVPKKMMKGSKIITMACR